MKLSDFLRDKIPIITANVIGMILLSLLIYAFGVGLPEVVLILICWLAVLIVMLMVSYQKRKRYFNSLKSTLAGLEQKYLISDLMEKPQQYEDTLYADILRAANKSMLEQVSQLRADREEYREYIEQWIHEVKTPLSAMKLLCENSKGEERRNLLAELEKTEHYIDQALFFARSENPEKDYIIRKTDLASVAGDAVSANKQLLMGNGVSVDIDCPHSVYCDAKWIVFILEQLITNSIKYGAKKIDFVSREESCGTTLAITDDGIGIGADELPRVFEKGFTGTNGRNSTKSTGIGLYLCKRLCDKLGLGVAAQSQQGDFFRIVITFPGESFYQDMR